MPPRKTRGTAWERRSCCWFTAVGRGPGSGSRCASRCGGAESKPRAIERLPSVGRDPSELGDLRGDADYVRSRIDRIGAPVVLCGHSYGGMVITELADHPAVVHSIYLAALWPPRGQSAFDLFGGEAPEWIVLRGDGSCSLADDLELVRGGALRGHRPGAGG